MDGITNILEKFTVSLVLTLKDLNKMVGTVNTVLFVHPFFMMLKIIKTSSMYLLNTGGTIVVTVMKVILLMTSTGCHKWFLKLIVLVLIVGTGLYVI